MKANTLEELSQAKDTPQKTTLKQKFFDTPEKSERMSARLLDQHHLMCRVMMTKASQSILWYE